jgi:uncharacterized membrane protein YecN with MAPEG domain
MMETSMSAFQAAAFWMALNAFLLIYLSYRVGKARTKHKIFLGDGNNDEVRTAMRTHANYTEYAPFALGGLVVLALVGGNVILIHLFGAAFLFARISHLLGMGMGVWANGRFIGTLFTMLTLLATALALLFYAVFA